MTQENYPSNPQDAHESAIEELAEIIDSIKDPESETTSKQAAARILALLFVDFGKR